VGILIYALFLTDWVHEAKPTFGNNIFD